MQRRESISSARRRKKRLKRGARATMAREFAEMSQGSVAGRPIRVGSARGERCAGPCCRHIDRACEPPSREGGGGWSICRLPGDSRALSAACRWRVLHGRPSFRPGPRRLSDLPCGVRGTRLCVQTGSRAAAARATLPLLRAPLPRGGRSAAGASGRYARCRRISATLRASGSADAPAFHHCGTAARSSSPRLEDAGLRAGRKFRASCHPVACDADRRDR